MSDRPPSTPTPTDAGLETDPRFPSGPWRGFFLFSAVPGRHEMELRLTFRQGVMSGEGRDYVGPFVIRGKYSVEDGRCWWSKRYLGKHDVAYQGYNEGRGIWGLWDIPPAWRGGFHIWPEAMGDPNVRKLARAIDEPAAPPEVDLGVEVGELVTVGAGAEVEAGAW